MIKKIFFICLFSVTFFLFSCSKVDTDWHRYQGRQAEGWKNLKNEELKIISDGWKIIGKTENKKYYEWGWEIVLIAPIEKTDTINEKQKEKDNPKTEIVYEAVPIEKEDTINEKQKRKNNPKTKGISLFEITPIYYCIKEIQYILHDKDGFELVSDKLTNDGIESRAGCFDFGENVTFRKTSIMSQSQANRAVKSSFRIVKY